MYKRDLVRLLCALYECTTVYTYLSVYIPYTPPDSNYYTDVCVLKASSR